MRILRRARVLLTSSGMLMLLAIPCSSQVAFDAGYRNDRYYGSLASAVTEDGQVLRFRPLRPDLFELAVHRQTGPLRLGLSYARASFGVSADDGATILEFGSDEVLQEVAFSAAIQLRPGIRLSAGPQLGFWSVFSEPTRTVLGAHAALELAGRVAGPVSAYSRAGVAYVGRVLSTGQLDPDQATGTLTRRSLLAGVRLEL